MTKTRNMNHQLIIPSAEPFLFPGGKTGCLLVHGFTGTPKEMRPLAERLNQKKITIFGVRLAGHATKTEDLVRTRWQDWLLSVEDGIQVLSNLCEEIFLGGLSMGGMLSLIASSRYPNLKGVIAMATPIELPRVCRLRIARPLSLFIPNIRKDKNESQDQLILKDHVDYPVYPIKAIAELNDLTVILRDSLPKIKIPVLLINSQTDKTVPLVHAQRIKELLTSATVEQVVLEKSGHMITEDFDRESVFEAVNQFIRRYSR